MHVASLSIAEQSAWGQRSFLAIASLANEPHVCKVQGGIGGKLFMQHTMPKCLNTGSNIWQAKWSRSHVSPQDPLIPKDAVMMHDDG